MTTKHTPGPWTVRKSRVPVDGQFDYGIGADIDGREFCIAEAFGVVAENTFPNVEANARLIAAAPELLAALEGLVGHFNAFKEIGGGWGNQEQAYYCLAKGAQGSWAKAIEAIAKAEGRS